MAMHSITSSGQLPERSRDYFAFYDAKISGAERDTLGAFRGLAFALLIETAMFLFGAVGWELWRMIR